MKLKTLILSVLITFSFNAIAQIELNLSYENYLDKLEENRVCVLLQSSTDEIEILNDTIVNFKDNLLIPAQEEKYILSVSFENNSIGNEEISYPFSIIGSETNIDINLRISTDNFDKNKRQRGSVEIIKYYKSKHNLEIHYLPKEKGDDYFKPPFFMLKNNSNDTIYGQYCDYFWGSISYKIDSVWSEEYFGGLDTNFGGGQPLYPDSITTAWVGSFGWRSKLPKNRYRYTLLYSTDRNTTSGIRKYLEKENFIWWADTKEYYRLIYEFDVE